VFAAIEACHQAVHAMGCPRVYTTVKINMRTDKDQTLEDKVASVQALLCTAQALRRCRCSANACWRSVSLCCRSAEAQGMGSSWLSLALIAATRIAMLRLCRFCC
jgi:hypothetical protein